MMKGKGAFSYDAFALMQIVRLERLTPFECAEGSSLRPIAPSHFLRKADY